MTLTSRNNRADGRSPAGVAWQAVLNLINRELVAEHWANIERVAEALVERGTLHADEVEALLGPTPDRVKLSEQQQRKLIEWAEGEGVIEALRLYGSRAKGFARSRSDIDLAVTTSFGHYTALARAWEGKLSDKLDLKVHVKQYNLPADDNPVPGYCNVLCLILFERQPTVGGFKRPRSSGSTVG
jgi:predicted nucleotidyltransferase